MELTDRPELKGLLRFFERPAGGSVWTQVLEAENIVLNQWYTDLFQLMGVGTYPPAGVADLWFQVLALGTGGAPPVPTAADTGLVTEWGAGAGQVPQRMSLTLYAAAAGPGGTWSFYLSALANTVSVTFTEAGLMYNNPSSVAAGAGKFGTHAVFSYVKGPNVDLRVDYTLVRIPT